MEAPEMLPESHQIGLKTWPGKQMSVNPVLDSWLKQSQEMRQGPQALNQNNAGDER